MRAPSAGPNGWTPFGFRVEEYTHRAEVAAALDRLGTLPRAELWPPALRAA
jgi:hypothetical protein